MCYNCVIISIRVKEVFPMDARIQKMADVLINYSTAVQPGERVLLRGLSPESAPLIEAMYQEALRAGGEAFTYIHISNEDALAIEASDDLSLLEVPNPMMMMMYETCDVIIRVESSENPQALADYPLDKQSARSKANFAPIKVQFKREAEGSLRRCTTQIPTQAYAQAAGMSILQFEDFFYGACKLHLDDPVAAWQAMAQNQQRLVDYINGKKTVQLRGPNIEMELSIDGRTFLNADGRINFPDGEIFTGPVEDSVNGWVQFTYPALVRGNEVLGARLTFEDGLVTQATADKGEDFLNKMLDTDDGSRRLGEFAIGTNNEIQRFTGEILLDEKIGGTIHMALGEGYPQTGSQNKSALHWDLICDMRQDSEILVDGDLFYKNGEFQV
jgi:aminopeptidase